MTDSLQPGSLDGVAKPSERTLNSSPARADFSAKTRRTLALRAGYRCSNPRCNRITVGPGSTPSEVTETGTASHIYAAASFGPRGTGSLDHHERQEISNGIWLCADCARLVDSNNGSGYSSSLLHSWRDLHESRIRAEQKGKVARFGWIYYLEVLDDRWTSGKQRLNLSRCNLIVGYIGTGKSCLASLLSAAGRPGELMRRVEAHHKIQAVVEWLDPIPRRMILTADRNALVFNVDGHDVPMVPRPYRCIVLSEDLLRPAKLSVSGLARCMGLDVSTMLGLLAQVSKRPVGRILEARASADEVMIRTHDMTEARSLSSRSSGGERATLVCDLAVILADIQSDVETTILILDGILNLLTPETREYLTELLASADRSFQTIAFDYLQNIRQEVGSEWLVTSLERTEDGTVFSQTVAPRSAEDNHIRD